VNPAIEAPPGPRVHQLLATLNYGDAIGNEAVAIARALRAAGYTSEIIVETADRRVGEPTVDYRDMAEVVAADDLLIHHFSLGSSASRAAFALPCRMVLVYHNITPPEYFVGVHDDLVRSCYQGRRELPAYRSRVELALGDSEFNRQELEALGFSPTAVLPVVPGFAHLDVAGAPHITAAYDDDWTNILFVGRLVPNKRPDDLVRFFHAYKARHRSRARLILAGSHAGFETYLTELRVLIARLGVTDVHLLGHVTNEELTALYDAADLFLCASEHEGFCVPIAEAFYKRVPVLAYAATAVPATMDGGGMLYDSRDPRWVASLMAAILTDPDLEARLLAAQDAALDRMRARDCGQVIVPLVRDVLAGPRRPPAVVAPEFWPQLRRHRARARIWQGRLPGRRATPASPGGVAPAAGMESSR
jgi:glycosyltransferase involved in cell wall biosynthesis